MIFFNDSNLLTSTGPIEVRIDGRHMVTLRRHEYAEIDIAPGSHNVALKHKELFLKKYYPNDYVLELPQMYAAVQVYTGLCSTKYSLVSTLPRRFQEKFRKVELLACSEHNEQAQGGQSGQGE